MLKAAHFDRYAGTWIGDGPEVDELFQAGLTDGEPEDGGGEWGRVAALNADGLAVRRIVMGVADA